MRKFSFKFSQHEHEKIQDRINRTVEDYIINIASNVRHRLDGVVDSYLGIDRSFGRVEVKNNSIIGKLVEDRARQVVSTLVGKLKWEPSEEELNRIADSMRTHYVNSIKKFIDYEVHNLAQQKAKTILSDVEIDFVLESVKTPTVEEISNPEYGSTPLQRILMEAQLDCEFDDEVE